MRRFITAALLALFVLQSSGAAMAGPPIAHPAAPPLLAQAQFAFSQVLESLASTHVGAFILGRESQYQAMHAPPPDFRKVRAAAARPITRPNLNLPKIVPQSRTGIELHPRVTDWHAFNLHAPPRDPLAMSHGVSPAICLYLAPGKTAPTSAIRRQIICGGGGGGGTVGTPTPTPTLAPTPTAAPTPLAGLSSTSTGINPWWTYEDGSVPGVGKWMVNVGTGNLIVQEDDVDVHERGIDLAFRATYNSMSHHDYAGSDGSTPSNYGNGWTNTFDAHLGFNGSNIITVWDIDGARYDYTSDGAGNWIAPPGQHAILEFDGGCGYYWIKKTGTRYHFEAPYAICGTPQGYWGRLAMIQARNYNNWIRFDYFWDNGDASTSAHLSQINAVHADGHALTLRFADFNDYRELASITRPDGVQVTYDYDSSGNLNCVHGPVNNSGWGTHCYGWSAGHQMNWATSPRWASQNGSGGYAGFTFDSSARVTNVFYVGFMNFTPADGTNTPIAGGYPTSGSNFKTIAFTYSSPTETQLTDSDGHASNWFYDGAGRVTQTQEWTGAPNNLWLTSYTSWDGANNLTESVDPRGNPTDYGYDGNGNAIWVQEPQVTTSMGTGRPVARYTYDGYSNLVAYCDPQYVWTTGASTCNPGSGVTYYTWNYSDTNIEPYGYLTDTHTPLGYHVVISYNSGANGGDTGLPTDVVGDFIAQLDGTTAQPQQHFTYDSRGNTATYNKGYGNWSLSYDTLNRLTAAVDPDGVTSRTCYYQNGQISATQSAYQYALDGSTACGSHSEQFTYDADGNEISETHHYGQTSSNGVVAGVTQKWYDGADRLVEVQLPADKYTDNGVPSRTRYIYDLSQGNNVVISGTNQSPSFLAHGNLYKTQNYFNSAWNDVNGNAFDALNRSVARYQYSPGNGLQQWTSTYDSGTNPSGIPNSGLLVSKRDPMSVTTSYVYDTLARQTSVSFAGDGGVTPSRTYTFDPDGRTASIASSVYGTDQFSYDADGRETQYQEGSGGGLTAPAQLTYIYYPNGWRKSLQVSSSALTQQNEFTYDYRNDGARTKLAVAGQSQPFTWAYSNAGRELTQGDPLTGTAFSGTSGGIYFKGYTRVARTQQYDAYGQLASLELPDHGTYAGITHGTEGNITGATLQGDNIYGAATNTPWTGTVQYDYDVRNEQSTTEVNGQAYMANTFMYGHSCFAYGYLVTNSSGNVVDCQSQATVNVPAGLQRVDPYTGAALTGASSYVSKQNSDCVGYNIQVKSSLTYDLDGRQSTEPLQGGLGYASCGVSIGSVNTRTYDAENHAVVDSCTWTNVNPNYSDGSQGGISIPPCSNGDQFENSGNSSGGATTFTWGPTGKMRTVSGSNVLATFEPCGTTESQFSLHWDGDELLFITDNTGRLVQTNVEGLGGIQNICAAAPFKVNDRDFSGTVTAMTVPGNALNSYDMWMYAPSHSYGMGKQSVHMTAYVGTNDSNTGHDFSNELLFNNVHGDGYAVGGLTIQGVRAYDSSSVQWTAPDAYKGDVDDPMSQRSYMWNGNNPIAYSDPSGYCIEDGCVGEAAAGAALVEGGAEITAAVADAAGDEALASSARGVAAATARGAATAAAAGKALASDAGQGIYRFASWTENGLKTYIGKSVNIAKRLAAHIRSGKLKADQFDTVQTKAVSGNAATLRDAEQSAIDEAGGIRSGKLANKINAKRAPKVKRR